MGNLGELISRLGLAAAILAIVAIVFMSLREFWCGYFKINQIIALLKDIRDSLKSNNSK